MQSLLKEYQRLMSNTSPGPPALGTLCLVSGTLLGCLAIAELSTGIPFAMPRFWYLHRETWGLAALVLCLVGAAILRARPTSPPGRSSRWKPARAGRRFHSLVLYSREGCHLCDHALDLLAAYARFLPAAEEVDIDSDPRLVERFGQCVPVAEFDGRVRFRGQIDETLLRRLIEGTPPTDESSVARSEHSRRETD